MNALKTGTDGQRAPFFEGRRWQPPRVRGVSGLLRGVVVRLYPKGQATAEAVVFRRPRADGIASGSLAVRTRAPEPYTATIIVKMVRQRNLARPEKKEGTAVPLQPYHLYGHLNSNQVYQ